VRESRLGLKFPLLRFAGGPERQPREKSDAKGKSDPALTGSGLLVRRTQDLVLRERARQGKQTLTGFSE